MKRILLACFLLTGTCTVTFVQTATAQVTAPTVASFTTQVNLLDSQIGSGDLTSAQATWKTLHDMMAAEQAATRGHITSATTPADKATYKALAQNQRTLYASTFPLKDNMVVNRAALHTQLLAFAATM